MRHTDILDIRIWSLTRHQIRGNLERQLGFFLSELLRDQFSAHISAQFGALTQDRLRGYYGRFDEALEVVVRGSA